MTQDIYLSRRTVDRQAADALEGALRDAFFEAQRDGKSMADDEGQDG